MQRTVRASRRHRHASMVARSPVRIRIASDKGSEKKGPRQRVGDLRARHRPQAPATSTNTEVAWSGSVSSPIAALRRPQVITGSVNMAPKRARRTEASPASASPNQLTARSTRSERMLPGPPRPRGRQATAPAPYHPSPNARPARARSSPARSGARRRAVAPSRELELTLAALDIEEHTRVQPPLPAEHTTTIAAPPEVIGSDQPAVQTS